MPCQGKDKEMDGGQGMREEVHFCQILFSLDQRVLPTQSWLTETSHLLGCSSGLPETPKHLRWETVVPSKAELGIHFWGTSDGQLYSHLSV